jgi:hypothetical protein
MSRIVPLLLAVAAAAVILSGCGESKSSAEGSPVTGPLPEKGSDLFVVRGDATVSGNRIEIKTDRVEWFSDRPKRRAGVAQVDELAKQWQTYGFGGVPPNAALSGNDVDAEAVLTDPKTTDEGISFAFKPIRGDVGDGDLGQASVFVDSSAYDTDMHVYVKTSDDGWCTQQFQNYLEDPVILTAPGTWAIAPPQQIEVDGNGEQVFVAASVSGSTHFSVRYTVACHDDQGDDVQIGDITLAGSVPDSLSSNSFSCSTSNFTSDLFDTGINTPGDYYLCGGGPGSGYHVSSEATLSFNQYG